MIIFLSFNDELDSIIVSSSIKTLPIFFIITEDAVLSLILSVLLVFSLLINFS